MAKSTSVRIGSNYYQAITNMSEATGLPKGVIVTMALEQGLRIIAPVGSVAGEALGLGPVVIKTIIADPIFITSKDQKLREAITGIESESIDSKSIERNKKLQEALNG